MLYRILTFLVGLILATIGIMFTIIYISYLDVNYTFNEFYNNVIKHIEILYAPIGISLMLIACFGKFKLFTKTVI